MYPPPPVFLAHECSCQLRTVSAGDMSDRGCGSRSKRPHLCCRCLTCGWDFKSFFLGMGWFTDSMRPEQWGETNHDLGKTLLSETQFAGLWDGDSGSALEDTREIQGDDVATMPRPGRVWTHNKADDVWVASESDTGNKGRKATPHWRPLCLRDPKPHDRRWGSTPFWASVFPRSGPWRFLLSFKFHRLWVFSWPLVHVLAIL